MNLNINFAKMRPPGFQTRIKARREELIERVTRGSGWLTVLACPICGVSNSKNTKYFEHSSIVSFMCGGCGCLYNDKIPRSVADVYDNAEYLKHTNDTAYVKEYSYRKERFGAERAEILRKVCGDLTGKRLLDVGCGTGFFLDVMHDYGVVADGQEISKPLASEASERLGVKIFTDLFEDVVPDEKYDIITMFDLIEHIDKPLRTLEHAKKLLTKNGVIFVMTPNYKSLAFDAMKSESNLYVPAEHLLFFSRQTVDFVAKALGMKVVVYSTNGMDVFDMLAYDRDIDGVDIKNSLFLKNINEFQNTVNTAQRANHMRFVLR